MFRSYSDDGASYDWTGNDWTGNVGNFMNILRLHYFLPLGVGETEAGTKEMAHPEWTESSSVNQVLLCHVKAAIYWFQWVFVPTFLFILLKEKVIPSLRRRRRQSQAHPDGETNDDENNNDHDGAQGEIEIVGDVRI